MFVIFNNYNIIYNLKKEGIIPFNHKYMYSHWIAIIIFHGFISSVAI